MSSFKSGDRVKIIEREINSQDIKSGLYYEYFKNLVGVIERVYDDGTASLKIELSSLPEDIEIRHHEVEETVKERWMRNMSEESKEKLSEKDQKVTLSYSILVNAADIEPAGKTKPAPRTPKPAKQDPPAEPRKSEKDIEKAEEEYLNSIAGKQEE